ncbi:MAG: hypothetical protein ABIL76_00155 [candidate division WOR-3 bacterium]
MILLTFHFINGYGDNVDNYAYSISITSANEIIVVGKDGGGMITKMDLNGNIKWAKRVGGLYTINDIVETLDGKYIVVGQTDAGNIFISKIDTNGIEIWKKSIYNGGLASGYKIVKLGDGNYLIIDYFRGIAVIDESGNVIKTRKENTYSNTIFYTGLARIEGSYLIAGNISSQGMAIVHTDFSIDYFTKADNPNASIYPYFIFQDDDSSCIITGSINSQGFIIRLDKNINPFQLKWAKIYNGTNNIKFISKTSDGNYIAIGNYKPNNDSTQIVIFKTDTLGNVIFSKIFKSLHNKFITSAIYKNGYVYVISNFKNVNNNVDFLVMKIDENLSGDCNFQNHNLTYSDFQLNRQALTHSYNISNSISTPSTSINDLNYNSYNFCTTHNLESCHYNISISISGYNLKIYSPYRNEMFYIYDVLGNLIKRGYLKENNLISFSKAGIYILKVKDRTYKLFIGRR